MDAWPQNTLDRLAGSSFRSRFALTEKDRSYLRERGADAIAEHARRFITERVAPAFPSKDGKQTPWRGHPVFVAQHATATCCRGCIERWHGMPKGRPLCDDEIATLVRLLMAWLTSQLTPSPVSAEHDSRRPDVSLRPSRVGNADR